MLSEPSGDQPIKDERLRLGRLGTEVQVLGPERRSQPPQPAIPGQQPVGVHGPRSASCWATLASRSGASEVSRRIRAVRQGP